MKSRCKPQKSSSGRAGHFLHSLNHQTARLLCTVFLVGVASGAQGQEIVFSENFNDREIHGWEWNTMDTAVDRVPLPGGQPWFIAEFNHAPSHPLNSPLIASRTEFEDTTMHADRWLISPVIQLPTTTKYIELSYRDVAGSRHVNADYELLISTSGGEPEQFQTLMRQEIAVDTIGHRVIDLTAYAGQTVRLAWRNISVGNTWVFLDDMLIRLMASSKVADAATSSVRFFPNPVADYLYVELLGTSEVKGGYIADITGKKIKDFAIVGQTAVATADLLPGSYVLVLHTGNGKVYRKFLKQ
jgi:hypothetical protein